MYVRRPEFIAGFVQERRPSARTRAAYDHPPTAYLVAKYILYRQFGLGPFLAAFFTALLIYAADWYPGEEGWKARDYAACFQGSIWGSMSGVGAYATMGSQRGRG